MDEDEEQRHPDTNAREPETDGGVFIGELSGGAVAVGRDSVAEDLSRTVGRRGPSGGPLPPPPGKPLPGQVSVGRMTGGALAKGRGARATDSSEQLVEATPALLMALRLLTDPAAGAGSAEPSDTALVLLRDQAAQVERTLQETGAVPESRMRRLLALAGRVAENAAAGVLSSVITGMLGGG